MTTEVEKKDDPVSALSMSDEDFLKAPPPEPVLEDSDEVVTEDKENTESDDEKDDDAGDDESGDSKDEEESSESSEKVVETSNDKPEKVETTEGDPQESPKDEATLDFEAEYKRILAPFKANGREIKVNSVDDAISLMQMGANYNKRMAALKPNLKIMRMLENNNLLDENKINFLIDLEKRNPDAINKLVKDSGIDPMDLSADKAEAYKQSTYNVDDKEIDLDMVLEELKDSPTYNQTLDIVGTKWDGASKQIIAGSPQILKLINGHVESGVYALISAEVESERMFGRLKGVSDIEAYRQVGDAIQARGGFNHLGSSQKKPESKEPVIVQPKPKQVDDDKLKDKKRAASSTKPVGSNSKGKEYNPLALSDEEFSKMALPQYS